MNKWIKYVIKGFGYTLMFILCFEFALYLIGYAPYKYQEYTVESHPRFPYLPDDSLGIKLSPGIFEITLNDSLTFTANHLLNGQRIVSESLPLTADEVHFLGCSFTYGYGVNDLETFVSLYQKDNPGKCVFNHGVIGYGTVQHYLQLKEIIQVKTRNTKTFNLIFSSHHLHRNTLSKSFRKDLRIGFSNSSQVGRDKFKNSKTPYISGLNPFHLTFESWDNMYSNLPGRGSFRCVNWLQNWTDYFSDNAGLEVEVAFELINRMVLLCNENGSELNILILDESPKVAELKKKLSDVNILFSVLQFDFSNHKLTNHPYDSHPSSQGHQYIYDKIAPLLK
jgi:hypothetical protein